MQMPGHASSGTEWKAVSSQERRAYILESRDSGKVMRMDNSRQMAEVEKQVRHYSSVRKMRNGKWAVQFFIRKRVTVTSCYDTVICPHRQLGSESRGEHWTWPSLCESAQSWSTFAAAIPVAQLHPRNIPSYRIPGCCWEQDAAGRADVAVGSPESRARLALCFLQKPHCSCEWRSVSLWEHLPAISKVALPLFCVWNCLQWLMFLK